MTSCCGRRPFTQAVPCPVRAPCCGTTTVSAPFVATTITLSTSTTQPVVLGTPTRVVAPCPSAVALIFTGTLQYTSTGEGPLPPLDVNLVLSYYNTLTPSLDNSMTVPIKASLSQNAFVPISAALDVQLPAGTYMVEVQLATETAVSQTETLLASGTLSATVARSGGPTCL